MPVGSRDEVNVEPGSFRASVVLWYACHDTLIFFFFLDTYLAFFSLEFMVQIASGQESWGGGESS